MLDWNGAWPGSLRHHTRFVPREETSWLMSYLNLKSSLGYLCVLGDSAVKLSVSAINRRVAKDAEVTQS